MLSLNRHRHCPQGKSTSVSYIILLYSDLLFYSDLEESYRQNKATRYKLKYMCLTFAEYFIRKNNCLKSFSLLIKLCLKKKQLLLFVD